MEDTNESDAPRLDGTNDSNEPKMEATDESDQPQVENPMHSDELEVATNDSDEPKIESTDESRPLKTAGPQNSDQPKTESSDQSNEPKIECSVDSDEPKRQLSDEHHKLSSNQTDTFKDSTKRSTAKQVKEDKRKTTEFERAEMEIIESFRKPIVELETAIDREREKQEGVFRQLELDNQKLKKENRELEQHLQDQKLREEVIKADVQKAQNGNKKKDEKILQLDIELKTLVVSKKSKKMTKKMGEGSEEPDARVLYLQNLLKRIAVESAQKDKRLIELQKERKLTENFIQGLQKELDEQTVAALRQKMEESRGYSVKTNYYDPTNVITKGGVEQSEVCAIQ